MMFRCSGGSIQPPAIKLLILSALATAAAAQDPATLARAFADNPNAANRTALLSYANAHKDATGGVALLAVAAQDATTDRKAEALRNLAAVRTRLPQLADFVDYLAATVNASAHDFTAAARECENVLKHSPKSPLAGQAAMLGAKSYIAAKAPARALEILRRSYEDLPQPDGDAAMAGAYDAVNDQANAVLYDQRVWLEYPASTQAVGAEAELNRLRTSLGAAYRQPTPTALLARATKLIDARDYARARRELTDLATATSGTERDLALVRIGASDQRSRKDAIAMSYLQALKVTNEEADAERLYYILAAARRLNRLDVMEQTLEQLASAHPKSPWRLQALVAGGNEYFYLNQPQNFEPLFWTCHEAFPQSSDAAYCHWRVAFSAYLADRKDATELLKGHLRQYPQSDRASAALYFLGRIAERASKEQEARAWYDEAAKSFPNFYHAVLARGRRDDAAIKKAAPSAQVTEFLRTVKFPTRGLPGNFEPAPTYRERIDRARLLDKAALDQFAELELRFAAKSGNQPEAFGLELARETADRAPNKAIRYLKRYAPGYLSTPIESAPREFWTLAFPLPWRKQLEQYSQDNGLDPFMVAALIRQESEFDPNVISHAKAYGLTQVLPSTGRELSRRLNVRGFSARSLLDPEINLKLGTHYLKTLLAQFDGQWEPTLASYNAGKSRVTAWQSRMTYREPAEFVEMIPFTETRNYVQSVLRNADVYRRVYQR